MQFDICCLCERMMAKLGTGKNSRLYLVFIALLAVCFESYLVRHPEDRFSRNEAHFIDSHLGLECLLQSIRCK